MPNAVRVARYESDEPREDHFVQLQASWADYMRTLKMRGDHSAPRITYADGTLEIMSPSFDHEAIKAAIGRMVECYCLESDIEFSAGGSWTLKDKRLAKGVEADECYIFGPRTAAHKVPDLAIEVIWTSGGMNKLSIYAALGVSEVWVWRRGKIVPYVLQRQAYKAAAKSKVLPKIDLQLMAACMAEPTLTTSAVIKRFRAAL